MNRLLHAFAMFWLGLVFIANAVAIVGFYIDAPTIAQGYHDMREIFSPFNLANWLTELISMSPGLLALYWRQRRIDRATHPTSGLMINPPE